MSDKVKLRCYDMLNPIEKIAFFANMSCQLSRKKSKMQLKKMDDSILFAMSDIVN